MITFCALTLWGCAIPEKSTVPPPHPSRVHPPAASPGYPPSSGPVSDAKAPPNSTAPLLDIADDKPGQESEENIERVLPSMVYVNDRIFEYGRKLDRWKELDSQSVAMDLKDEDAARMVRCFRELQNVLNGYSDLRTRMLQAEKTSVALQISSDTILDLQKQDIAFLENSCGQLLSSSEAKSAGWKKRETGTDLTQLETLIDMHGGNREFEEVVQAWSQIPQSQVDGVHLRTKIMYGNALMYLHQQEKAAEVYQQIVDQMSSSNEQSTDLVSLRRILADLYIASGNYQAAEKEYQKISSDYQRVGKIEEWSKLQLSMLGNAMKDSPELAEYSSMLRDYLGFIPEQDGYKVVWQAEKFLEKYPYSPVVSNVDYIKDAARAAADSWFNGLVAEVDRLSAEKQFTEALALLLTLPNDMVSAEQQLLVEEKNEALLLAEAVDKETNRMVVIQDLQNQWNNGLLLEKGGRYDEAIALYTNLLNSEYSVKAKEKINSLSLEAANNDRREAANLFMRYTKTTDLESRKKLLIESRRLLKDILVKYPDVEIRSKVIGNINRVEQEMNALDPNLILLADGEEKSNLPAAGDGVDNIFATPAAEGKAQQTSIIEKNLDLPVSQ